jgi:hypothetical protein
MHENTKAAAWVKAECPKVFEGCNATARFEYYGKNLYTNNISTN